MLRDAIRRVSDRIANGHAYLQHVLEDGEFESLGITTPSRFSALIQQVVWSAIKTGTTAALANSRITFDDCYTGVRVVMNPFSDDFGTAFRFQAAECGYLDPDSYDLLFGIGLSPDDAAEYAKRTRTRYRSSDCVNSGPEYARYLPEYGDTQTSPDGPQATWAGICVTPRSEERSDGRASGSLLPPGWKAFPGVPPNAHPGNRQRGHLVGNQFGGTGQRYENIVTQYGTYTNLVTFPSYERKVRDARDGVACDGHGCNVWYEIVPIYIGDHWTAANLLPTPDFEKVVGIPLDDALAIKNYAPAAFLIIGESRDPQADWGAEIIWNTCLGSDRPCDERSSGIGGQT